MFRWKLKKGLFFQLRPLGISWIVFFLSRGFVTFGKPESAERAIAEMHQKNISGIQLQVQLARRQPQIEPINEASSSAVWSTIGKLRQSIVNSKYFHEIIFVPAASQSQKGSHKDKREMVQYDDIF